MSTYLIGIRRVVLVHKSEQAPLEVVILKPVAPVHEVLEIVFVVNDIVNVLLVGAAVDTVDLHHGQWRATFVFPSPLASVLVNN